MIGLGCYCEIMKRRNLKTAAESHMLTGIAEVTAEHVRLGGEVLNSLVHAVAANEKVQQRFRETVLMRLSRIETLLVHVQGAQLSDSLGPPVTDEKRESFLREVGERIAKGSEELGLRMVKYVYGAAEALGPASRGRRKASD